jgi:hypothetical protein
MIVNQSKANTAVPEGQLKIARYFSAGTPSLLSQVPKGRPNTLVAINFHQAYSKLIKPNQGFFRKKLFLCGSRQAKEPCALASGSLVAGPKQGPSHATLCAPMRTYVHLCAPFLTPSIFCAQLTLFLKGSCASDASLSGLWHCGKIKRKLRESNRNPTGANRFYSPETVTHSKPCHQFNDSNMPC